MAKLVCLDVCFVAWTVWKTLQASILRLASLLICISETNEQIHISLINTISILFKAKIRSHIVHSNRCETYTYTMLHKEGNDSPPLTPWTFSWPRTDRRSLSTCLFTCLFVCQVSQLLTRHCLLTTYCALIFVYGGFSVGCLASCHSPQGKKISWCVITCLTTSKSVALYKTIINYLENVNSKQKGYALYFVWIYSNMVYAMSFFFKIHKIYYKAFQVYLSMHFPTPASHKWDRPWDHMT